MQGDLSSILCVCLMPIYSCRSSHHQLEQMVAQFNLATLTRHSCLAQ